ncbi:MAG: hypothetical protein ACI8ZB_002673 [Desulforhopalus sp.]|jgi:hypothetical protein
MRTQFIQAAAATATATIMCYVGVVGAGVASSVDFTALETSEFQLKDATGIIPNETFTYIAEDILTVNEKAEVLHDFTTSFLSSVQDLEPSFSKTVDDNFWDLI